MNNSKTFKLRERSRKLLGLNRIFTEKDLQNAFKRQIFLIHPDKGKFFINTIDNLTITKLIIQAYGFLMKRNFPTTMLEDNELVSKMIEDIGPLDSFDIVWNMAKFYDDFNKNIWPENENVTDKMKYKFKGI